MKISIITVSFNSVDTIKDTIKSVLAQTYSDIEYIIVDGGSKDGTLDVIKRYADRIQRVISEPDQGIYDAMNKGIDLATGDVIGILNSDDFYENEGVISLVAETFRTSGAGVVFGDLVFVDRNNINCVRRYYSSKKFRPWKLRVGWMPPHPTTFIRASVYEKVGSYALNYKIAADYEMFVRMLLVHNISFQRIPRILVRMRLGGASTNGIKSSWLRNKEIVRACQANNNYTNIFFVLSKIPFKLLELFRRPNAAGG